MPPARITVLLPCHSMEDFPSWLDGDEARDLLDAWTAAWHPTLVATVGSVPGWASLDRGPDGPADTVFIVPAAFDERLAGTGLDAMGGVSLVRRSRGRRAIVQAALGAIGCHEPSEGIPLADDFHALGLARLLSELLALRMRSSLSGEIPGFDASALAAARAALAGDEAEARARLGECFETLAAVRRRYYPVDIWLLDLVLLAGSTLGDSLGCELATPGVRSLVATGELMEAVARSRPDLLMGIRDRAASGDLGLAGGLWDDTAIHAMTPEAILASLERARAAFVSHAGVAPPTFARRTGGFSAILPQLLEGLGFSSAIYHSFDGSFLPDAGVGRVRWEGPSGAAIEAVACPPLDARSPHAAVALADSIGEELDHSHTAVVAFAHYPGTAAGWFHDFRRIHRWSDVFGRFATADEVVRETVGAGVRADFEPDAFRDRLPTMRSFSPSEPEGDPIDAAIARAAAAARGIRERQDRLPRLPPPAPPTPSTTTAARRSESRGWLDRLRGRRGGRPQDDAMRLDNGMVALRVHPETGGILSFRRAGGGSNRLSQQLAVRSTHPLPAGSRHEDPLDRADYSLMVADKIDRIERPDGSPGVMARGRLMVDGGVRGRFSQQVWLEPAKPIAVIELGIDLEPPLPAPDGAAGPFDHYAACRFAWSENDDVELHRSLHTQSVASERTLFFADWFVELRADERCAILTAGLPWHVRSGPHMLDTIVLAAGRASTTRRLAIGLGLDAPWEAAMDLLCDEEPRPLAIVASPPARITGGETIVEGGVSAGLRIGVLESRGRAGLARLRAPRPLAEAWRIDVRGKRERPLAIEDGQVQLDLARYEWAMVELRFAEGVSG